MKLKAQQLQQHLNNQPQSIYLVYGDEPLLIQEACDTIRSYCNNNGFTDREVFYAESGFDWQELLAANQAMSLFSERKLIELRLANGKPGDAGSKALVEYAANASPDNILLVICNKLESATYRSKWFKALEVKGAAIQVWPIDAKHLPGWLNQRLQAANLKTNKEALQLLTERVEGNLLAAAQEVEKLKLYAKDGFVDEQTVESAVLENARYNMFNLVDNAIAGKAPAVIKMLRGLKAEGIDAVVILWALTRELRSLALCAELIAQGNGIERVLQSQKVWDRKKPLFKQALQRVTYKQFTQLLDDAKVIDQSIKGINQENTWDKLEQLFLAFAGKPILNH